MKNLTAIALFMFSNVMLFAQTSPNPDGNLAHKFKGGIMVNPFISWVSPNVDDPTKSSVSTKEASLGFSYGLLGEYYFSNNYGISTNLRVSGFNAEFQYTPPSNPSPGYISIDRTLHLQYIDLPITLKMQTNEVGYARYFAQFGFMPSVKLGAKGDIDTLKNPTTTSSVKNYNVNNNVNILMLYSVIGIGMQYNLGGTTSLVGSITWNNGFTNIWSKNYGEFNSPPENISLNLGVLF